MINVKVNFSTIKIDFQLEHHISCITGDSGVGKSLLCSILGSADYLHYTTISPSDYKIIVANSGTISTIIKAETNAIVFADNLTSIETSNFAKLCFEYLARNNLYLVLITRAEVKFGEFCIYNMIKLCGVERALVPLF